MLNQASYSLVLSVGNQFPTGGTFPALLDGDTVDAVSLYLGGMGDSTGDLTVRCEVYAHNAPVLGPAGSALAAVVRAGDKLFDATLPLVAALVDSVAPVIHSHLSFRIPLAYEMTEGHGRYLAVLVTDNGHPSGLDGVAVLDVFRRPRDRR